jgi:predicted secreted protein
MAYSISTALAIYFVLWWVTLFLTLPFGVRSQHEDGEGDHGDFGGHFRDWHVGLPGRLSLH